jgi:PAS domain S-box-containing protein
MLVFEPFPIASHGSFDDGADMTLSATDHSLNDSIKQSDHLFELILQASPDLIYVYDRIDERYVFVSERSTTMLGYSPQQIKELSSEDIQEWIHPEDLAHAKAHYARQEYLSDTEISRTTYRVRHAAGDYRLIRCRQKVLSRTVTREAKYILGVGTDITAEANRRSELEALRTQILRIRDDERRRIALHMHDTAVQQLIGTAFLLKGVEARLRNDEGMAALGEARVALSRALRDILEPFAA